MKTGFPASEYLPERRESAIQLLLFLTIFTIFFGSRYHRLYSSSAIHAPESTVLFLHETGGLDDLAHSLDSLSIVVDPDNLRWAGSVLGWRNFQPGRYELSGGYSYDDLLSRIARGIQDHARVTIPPGINPGQLSVVLSGQLSADSSDFARLFEEGSSLLDELDLTGDRLFARMLPDTYNIYWTGTPERVVRRLLSEFEQRVVNTFGNAIEQSEYSLDEILTLASIVEWEAVRSDEKPVISGLYLNRLDRNMPLQADPTVNYAVGERRRLLYEDYQIEHPYNTYLFRGLPPGPITNPDLSSIRAALYPEEHEYIFMVANPEGGHTFSRTYQEHLVASAIWREWLQEQYRIRDERERLENGE
ncbi:MAG: endolytic transglycosylase MltG [Balneolaceae bacterium]